MSKRSALIFLLIFPFLTQIYTFARAVGHNSFPFESGTFTTDEDSAAVHELTIYVIPSFSPLNWESPASLYRSTFESYTKSLFKTHKYSIGHLFIEFSTPLIDSVVLTSIRSSSDAEKRRLALKDKIGLGMLGAVLQGRMESRAELSKKIAYFSKKKQLAFIKYRISKESALRVIEFLKAFCSETREALTPSHYYGGAFWPRFINEGAGCSSFGMSVMEVAGLFIDYPDWRYSVNIPINLIGGVYNNGVKVKQRTILKTNKWHSSEGNVNVDYVPITLYDPSLIFNWIILQRKTAIKEAVEINNIPGLYFDSREINLPEEVPIFFKRKNPSLFIDIFKHNLK